MPDVPLVPRMNRILSKYLVYLPTTLARGENVLRYLPAKRRNQFVDPMERQASQESQLRAILLHAKNRSAFYSELDLSAMPQTGAPTEEFFSWFRTLPYLRKQDLIESGERMRTHSSRLVSLKTTGGSTGEPVRIFKNADALAHERSATWRAYEWAGVSIGDKQLRFWGVPLSGGGQAKARVIDFIANRRRISAFDLSSAALGRHHASLMRYKPAYIYGYASAIQLFAGFIVENGLPVPPSVRAVISTSEVLTDHIRTEITSGFQVPVFNEYGCGEVGSIAHECRAGSMHIMSDNLFVELDPHTAIAGEVVVTDLHNTEMPLIRYRVGDFASLQNRNCDCGVTFSSLEGLHGRAYDMILTPEGRRLHPESVMYVVEALQAETGAFRHFQAIQIELDLIQVRVVPTDRWSESVQSRLVALLQRHITPGLRVIVEHVERIDRERSGKLRVIKSLLTVHSE